MRLFSNKRGMTLIEVVVSIGILSLLGVGMVAILMHSLRGWASGTGNETANSTAITALNRLTYDIREARSAVVVGGQLVVTFPKVLTDPTSHEKVYDSDLNDAVLRSYYVNNGNLMRSMGGTTTVLRRGVSSATFVAAANAVEITIVCTQRIVSSERLHNSDCTQQATGRVTFRNYH